MRKVNSATTTHDKAAAITSLFLVLPEIPENAPDWLSAFDRITVAPTKTDLVLLLKTLESAIPASLRKGKPGTATISVRIDPANPDAVPIDPHYLRTEFTKKPDRFHADIGTANGRLNEGYFDSPPGEFVKELCALGLEGTGILRPGEQLSAHQAWPFIASSLALSGTPGPFWFLVRRSSDIPQLTAQLDRVARLKPPYFEKNYGRVKLGIIAIQEGSKVARSGLFEQLIQSRTEVERRRDMLIRRIRDTEGTNLRLPTDLEARVREIQERAVPVGPVLLAVLDPKTGLEDSTRVHWGRILGEVASSREDLPAVFALTKLPRISGVGTAARKAFQLIDFIQWGPDVEVAKKDLATAPPALPSNTI